MLVFLVCDVLGLRKPSGVHESPLSPLIIVPQIILGAIVTHSPACVLSREALRELEEAVPFYEVGSRSCRRPASLVRIFLPCRYREADPLRKFILEKLRVRAASVFAAGNSDSAIGSLDPDGLDDLKIMVGLTSFVPNTTPEASLRHDTHAAQEANLDALMQYYWESESTNVEMGNPLEVESVGQNPAGSFTVSEKTPIFEAIAHIREFLLGLPGDQYALAADIVLYCRTQCVYKPERCWLGADSVADSR